MTKSELVEKAWTNIPIHNCRVVDRAGVPFDVIDNGRLITRDDFTDILTRFANELKADKVDVERPKIITLCGSSRFTDVMAILAWEFEKEGYITLGLHLLPMDYAKCESHLAEKQGVAEKMDALHKQKIKLGDEIFIVNVDGYIGDSTKSEIRFALEHNKRIRWLQPEHADDNLAAALLAAKKEGM